jgi:hypothetical protein
MQQMMLFPKNIEGITPAWLSEALSVRWPGIQVSKATPIEVLHGAATKVRLAMEYAAPGAGKDQPPKTMWLKIGFEQHNSVFSDTGIYAREASFYKDVRPVFDLRLPECYFAGVQSSPSQFALLLEDLLDWGATFSFATSPLGIDEAKAALTALAGLHAQSWGNNQHLVRLGVLPTMAETLHVFEVVYKPNLENFFNSVRGFAVPVALHDKTRLLAALEAYVPFVSKNFCMTHGDLHVGNTFRLPDGSFHFLDWQVISIGHWAQDFAFFLISALDTPVRRIAERDLLKHYLAALVEKGVAAPRFDDAWDDYRRAAFYGFLVWLGNADTWQPPQINMASFARHGAAMLDLDTYNVLGV